MKGLLRLLFPHRIGRLEYFLRCLVFLSVAALVGRLMYWWLDHTTPGLEDYWINACVLLFVVTLLGFYRAVLVPRLQDADMSRAWVLVILIPSPVFLVFLSVILLLVPTDDHPRPTASRSIQRKPRAESPSRALGEPKVRAPLIHSIIRLFFPDRSSPSEYFTRGIVFLVIVVMIGIQYDQLQQGSPEWRKASPFFWMIMIITLCRSVVIPRLEDAGWNRTWILLILVPVINLLFLVKLLDTPSMAFDESPEDLHGDSPA